MSSDTFSLSLINLALDGSLDLFIDLYRFTYNAYLKKLQETPQLVSDRDNWNCSMIPEILPEFQLLAFRRLRIFTTKIKNIHLQLHHFKYFNFFDEDRIRDFERSKRFYQEWRSRGYKSFDERYIKEGNEEFEFQETVVGVQDFVNLFRLVIIRAIKEEIQKDVPSYTVFDARHDVDDRIAERMRMRRNECIVPEGTKCSPNKEPLYVFNFLNNTVCRINRHPVVSKKYYAKHIDGKRTVALPVHYCEICDRYMIGSLSLSLFKEYSGDFIAHISKLISDNGNEWDLLGESRLHQFGYNVIDGKLTAAERQSILISLVESKRLTFFEVIATIEKNIRIFERNYKMQNAVIKWRSDLQFINEYMINEKRDSRNSCNN